MPICPHCETRAESLLAPCPTGDGYHCIAEGEFAAFRGDAMLGRNISGRYVVTSVIGRGAIGRVYKGHQAGVEREVVLKIFKLENILDERMGFEPGETLKERRSAARARFVREAQVLGQLTHPNCVTIYDFGITQDGTLLYIAMEFAVGISLRKAIGRGLKAEAGVEILLQILRALREAHSLDVVHRDLKPENIIVSFDHEDYTPRVKVLDFGIAKLVGQQGQEAASLTTAGMLFGTPAYMSPEQCRGAVDEVGPPSDVYAFGCLAFELLTGQLPYPAPTPQQMILMHQDHDIPRMRMRPGMEVPPGMEAFVRKCLSKDPAQRYPSARVALRIIEDLFEGWAPSRERPAKVDTSAEIQALRHAELGAAAAPGAPGAAAAPGQGGAAHETVTGPTADERASRVRPRLPSDGRTAVGPRLRAGVDERASRHLQIAVGAALVLLLVFCALLFLFFYRVL